MELGASWIHGTKGNPLTALARDAGARMVETSYDEAIMLGPDGAEIDPDTDAAERLIEKALEAAEDGERDVSVLDAITASKGWKRADGPTRRLAQQMLNAGLEQEYGGPASALSSWFGDNAETFDGDDALLPDGYDRIVSLLAAGLDIRLSHRVTQVAPGAVTLADGRRIEADRIVITVPLGVLRNGSIRFAQPLAGRRRKAIETLRMGLLNKCWLRFDRIAWPDDVDWIEWLGPRPGYWAQWVSLANTLDIPVLLGFNAADSAAEIETLDDRATIAAAHEALRAMFGARFPEPRAAQITRWGRDPFSRGSYSYNAVGMDENARDHLFGADWDGALWFAGEATMQGYYGTAHGAVLSGRRIAKAMART